SAAAVNDTVTRDLPASADAGASITVNLTVDVETSATYYSIDEAVPSGWNVTSATDGGDYTSETGHVKWVVTSGATDATYSYTVLVPTDASDAYTFDGIYIFEGMTGEATILGDTTVTIVAAPTLTWQVEPPTSVTQGNDVTFDVSFSEAADYYIRIENSTGGVVWRSPASGTGHAANPTPRTWATTTATPTGDYTIIININGADNSDTRTVTVTPASPVDDTVTRDLPVTAGAGAPITVDLAVDVETGATFYSIDEIVPSGWTVTSATDGGDYTTTPGHVFWALPIKRIRTPLRFQQVHQVRTHSMAYMHSRA
ncbi:MAG: hypothetical protein GWP10_12935, partial [Nitrospiraceae bacterium]|nr:hypothetical protein [Nitrospiraceae bacterium]